MQKGCGLQSILFFFHFFPPGLKIEGLYRRCGSVPKISKLLGELRSSPVAAALGTDELDVLDVAGAMKQFLREMDELISLGERGWWATAAGDVRGLRFSDLYQKKTSQRGLAHVWDDI